MKYCVTLRCFQADTCPSVIERCKDHGRGASALSKTTARGRRDHRRADRRRTHRHSVLHGLLTGKPATAISREKAVSAPYPARAEAGENAAPIEAHALSSLLRVTNPDRVIDKSTGITKIDLVRCDWDTAKGFSQAVVVHLSKTLPQMFVAKSGPRNRLGKIFIDYLRNGLGATTVCAWSARARPGLGISVPVWWDELPKLTGGNHWTIRSVQTRLNKGNDPWKEYSTSAKTLNNAMKTLGYKA
jgi:hypothetical protein